MADTDIAIVGMSCIFPGAADLGQYWKNLVGGVDAVQDIPVERWQGAPNHRLPNIHEAHLACGRGGFLPAGLWFDPLRYGIVPNAVRHGDADQYLMLQVIDQALRDAGIETESPVRERTDVLIGRGSYPGYKQIELAMRGEIIDQVLEFIRVKHPGVLDRATADRINAHIRESLSPNDPDSLSSAIPNIIASRTANRLNLRGAASIIDGACASSLLAVEQGMWRLRNGLCDAVVAAGVFLTNVPSFAQVFARLGALSPQGVIRPFDRRADGLVIGEGGGAVILKRLEDACRDGDRIYAIVKGAGSSSDGREVDVMAPSTKGQLLCLERAYADARVDPETINYLEAHGTATAVGDRAEVETIKTFFGTSTLPATARSMGSVKSMLGHLMPASGMASLIKVALALSNKVVPPTLHCEEPREDLADAPFYPATRTRPWFHDVDRGLRRAGINAFGFGGINAHLVLEEVPQPAPKSRRRKRKPAIPREISPGTSRPSELLVFAANGRAELIASLERIERFFERDQTEATLGEAALTLSGEFNSARPVKLAIVARDISEFRRLASQMISALAEGNPEAARDERIAYSEDAARPPGKIACIFPGMAFPGMAGSYPDHLIELALHFPDLRAEFDFFEGRDHHPLDPVPTTAIFSPPPTCPEEYRQQLKSRLHLPSMRQESDGPDDPAQRYLATIGVTLGNWLCWVLLRKFAIPVDMMVGQSQGEMAAICAAGLSDFHETAPCYWRALNIDPKFKRDELVAFSWVSADRLAPHLDHRSDVHIAIHVAPEATIFGGNEQSVREIVAALEKESVFVQILPFPPIHTPCMSHLRDEVEETLRNSGVKLGKAEVALYSSITSEQYPENEEGIGEHLIWNLDRPVKMWQTIRRMYDDGARVFLQAGGGQIASAVKTLVADESVVGAALDADTRDPLTQLNLFCATLIAAGVTFSLDPLFERRGLRRLDLDAPAVPPLPPLTAVSYRLDWALIHRTFEDTPPAAPASGSDAPLELSAVSADESGFLPMEDPGASPEPAIEEVPQFSETGMPFIGTMERFVPEQELVMRRTLSADEDLFLADHIFVEVQGIKPIEQCYPTQPLTMSIELMAEAAALLAPERGLIGLDNLRASRWIALPDRPTQELRITARTVSFDADTGVQRIEVSIQTEGTVAASGTVLFGNEYIQELCDPVVVEEHGHRWPVAVEDLYVTKRLFHGPCFQCVVGLGEFGDPGFTGTLEVLPKDRLFASNREPVLLTDPCLLDGVGQLVGLWWQIHGWTIFPTGLEKLEFYGPTPPVGTQVTFRGVVTEFDRELKRIRADIDVEDGAGNLWFRISGWGDFIFPWSREYAAFSRVPAERLLGHEVALPGPAGDAVCLLIERDFLKGADLQRLERVGLTSREEAEFALIEDRRRRKEALTGRMAVKDAVRLWEMRRNGIESFHPALLDIDHDEAGRPFVSCGGEAVLPHISLSHSGLTAIAIAGDVECGIDIEPADRDTRAILPHFASSEEIEILERLAATMPDEVWETRLWCAKEAVAKMLGSGLQGRPKDYALVDADDEGNLWIEHRPTARQYVVNTFRLESFIVAATTLSALVAEPVISE